MKTYTIQEVSKITGLSQATLRYYDNEGLFPHLERKESNYRMFTDLELETLRIIECFKKAGLSIKQIRHYMKLIQEGDSTLKERLDIMENQKKALLNQLEEINKSLECVDFKINYYKKAITDGTEKYVHEEFLKMKGIN